MTFGVMQLALAENVSADTTPQPLPFMQDWTNIGLITVNDNWSMVPGVTGYLGDYRTTPGGNVVYQRWRSDPDPQMNFFYVRNATGAVSQFEWGTAADTPVAGWWNH